MYVRGDAGNDARYCASKQSEAKADEVRTRPDPRSSVRTDEADTGARYGGT